MNNLKNRINPKFILLLFTIAFVLSLSFYLFIPKVKKSANSNIDRNKQLVVDGLNGKKDVVCQFNKGEGKAFIKKNKIYIYSETNKYKNILFKDKKIYMWNDLEKKGEIISAEMLPSINSLINSDIFINGLNEYGVNCFTSKIDENYFVRPANITF